MKKRVLTTAVAMLLAACTQTSTKVQDQVNLTPPQSIRDGYIKLGKTQNYYIDTSSIWVDNEDRELVHFDAIINLDQGLYVYKQEPSRYARSVRQYKILNCKNYHLTQVRTDFYDGFWGEGLRAAPKHQSKHTIILHKNSSLYTIGQIICANTR